MTLLVAGTLLLTGASAGAILRRSGRAVRRAHSAARRSRGREEELVPDRDDRFRAPQHEPPIDIAGDYPDVLSDPVSTVPPLLAEENELSEETAADVFAPSAAARGDYRLPDRSVLRTSPPASANGAETGGASPASSWRRSHTSASRRRSSARSRAPA